MYADVCACVNVCMRSHQKRCFFFRSGFTWCCCHDNPESSVDVELVDAVIVICKLAVGQGI